MSVAVKVNSESVKFPHCYRLQTQFLYLQQLLFFCFVVSKVISTINHVTGTIKALLDITHLQGKD